MPGLLTDRLRTTARFCFEWDWERQRCTAVDILHRLQNQEGAIRAGVGMDKTRIALAVAVSHILSTPELRQIIIFVPAAVADKRVREWREFGESLLDPGTRIRCVDKPVRSGNEFLKTLDETLQDRAHIIMVTYPALTSLLEDTFIQLALLYFATRYIREGFELRQRIAKWSTGLTGVIPNSRFTPDRVARLLATAPPKWRELWESLTGEILLDDPVPEALEGAARRLDLHELRTVVNALPFRSQADIIPRLEAARNALYRATQVAWKWMVSSSELDFPPLIVDEAHCLENPRKQIGELFGERI